MLSLSPYLQCKNNNFNLLRFIVASTVVYQHCYLVLGYDYRQYSYLIKIINPVAVFFIISGFLISKSWDNSLSILIYARKRISRIFPALVASLFITIFIIGPICTNLNLKAYFFDISIYRYFLNNLIFNTNYFLSTVFAENPNKYANGALWSLMPEVFCYIMLAFFGNVAKKYKYSQPHFHLLIIAILLIAYQDVLSQPQINQEYLEKIIYFAIGASYYRYRQHIHLNGKVAIFLLLSYLINQQFYCNIYFNWLLLPYLVFYFSFARFGSSRFGFSHFCLAKSWGLTEFWHNFGKKSDLSYGIYIYHFPIQQTIVHFLLTSQILKPFLSNFAPELGNITATSNHDLNIILFAFIFVATYIPSLILAFLSYKYLEKPMLTIARTNHKAHKNNKSHGNNKAIQNN